MMKPQHMVVFLSPIIVFTYAGHEKSPVLEPGMKLFKCGSRLLAPTWAVKPMQICDLPIEITSSVMNME